jgi:hypothetical protein
LLERLKASIPPQEGVEKFPSTCRWQGVEPKLDVVGFVPPVVLVFRTVIDEEEEPGSRKTIDQAVEEGLRLVVDPVKILEGNQQGLDLALP